MAFFWGKGRNGKSTWVDVVATILGDYAMTIGFDTFLDQANKKKGSDATPDLARLPGVRFLRASEPEKGAKLAEGLIKEVTGGERIQARHLNKGFFEFLPSFKFTGQGNYRPKISGHDDGIWSRVRLVPWTVRIPDSEIDRALPEKLRAERSGIFNRMMAGLIDLKMYGLLESANIKQATEKYREASDALGRFLRDCTADKPDARIRSSDLLAAFTAWGKVSGAGEWSPQGFAKAMEDRGYERKTSNGVWWLDIEATADGRYRGWSLRYWRQPPAPGCGERCRFFHMEQGG
jgi:putative DNA primase/helicase